MQCFIANDWDEGEERDTTDFLELEKEIYEKMFPRSADDMNGREESDLALEEEEMKSARVLMNGVAEDGDGKVSIETIQMNEESVDDENECVIKQSAGI